MVIDKRKHSDDLRSSLHIRLFDTKLRESKQTTNVCRLVSLPSIFRGGSVCIWSNTNRKYQQKTLQSDLVGMIYNT